MQVTIQRKISRYYISLTALTWQKKLLKKKASRSGLLQAVEGIWEK